MVRTILACVLVIVHVLAMSAVAQPLADRVPDDALVYVGWRGVGSHAEAKLEAHMADALFDQFVPQLLEQIVQDDPDAAERGGLAADVARLMWRYPTAVYSASGASDGQAGGERRLGFVCRAGDDAGKLAAKLNALVEQKAQATPIEVRQYADHVVAGVAGDVSALHALAMDRSAGACLADNPGFAGALARVDEPAFIMAYADVQGVLAQADEVMAVVNPMMAAAWPQVTRTLGLTAAKRVVWTAWSDGADWDQRLFVEASASRMAWMENPASEPVTDDIFKVVPQNAAMVHVGRADPGKFLGNLRSALGELDPAFPEQFDIAMRQATAALGVDVDAELRRGLGPQWAVYTKFHHLGETFVSVALVSPLRDPPAVERALAALAQSAAPLMAEKMQDENASIEFRQLGEGDRKAYYLDTPVMPVLWMIVRGNLYVTSYPQGLASAVFDPAAAPNLLASDRFAAMRKRLGKRKVTTASFMDLELHLPIPRFSSQEDLSLIVANRMCLDLADLLGAAAPPMLLPVAPEPMRPIGPSGSITWVDRRGYHARMISPYPVWGTLAAAHNPVVAEARANAAEGARIAMRRAERTGKQMRSGTQVRDIHLACASYAADHRGRFPDDIGIVVVKKRLAVEKVLSPFSDKIVPEDFAGWPEAQQRRWVNENTSYVLVPGLTADNDSQRIAMFCKLQDSLGRGISIGWNDNHGTFEPISVAEGLILEQTGKTLQEWSNMVAKPAP